MLQTSAGLKLSPFTLSCLLTPHSSLSPFTALSSQTPHKLSATLPQQSFHSSFRRSPVLKSILLTEILPFDVLPSEVAASDILLSEISPSEEAPRSEAIEVITKRREGLFHAEEYFFTKFAKKIKNTDPASYVTLRRQKNSVSENFSPSFFRRGSPS